MLLGRRAMLLYRWGLLGVSTGVSALLNGHVVEAPVGKFVVVVSHLGVIATIAAEVEHEQDDENDYDSDDTVGMEERACQFSTLGGAGW